MKKKFNNEHTPKSSDNCDKYSKSVSYETLVGGTATTGREIKQTQRLFSSSTNKPLTAVGTLISLLCNSAKVMEKWLQTLPVFRLVKIIILISVLSVGMVAESWADDLAPTSGTCNSSGTCLWNLSSDGTLNIYAAPNSKDVVMDRYECDDSTGIGNRPWEQNIIKIKNLVVGDNITNIGGEAFQNALNLETVKGMKDVKTIGFDCFVGTAKLQTIETPSVETLGNFALASNSPYFKSVDLPNIKNMGYRSMPVFLEFAGLPSSNVSVNDSFKDCRYISNCSNENRAACGSCGDGYVMRGLGCVSDCGAGYLGKEGRCIDALNGCGAGYRQFENFCNRIRYTPAEAAEVLKDDNTNEVTITFKK